MTLPQYITNLYNSKLHHELKLGIMLCLTRGTSQDMDEMQWSLHNPQKIESVRGYADGYIWSILKDAAQKKWLVDLKWIQSKQAINFRLTLPESIAKT